MFRTKTSLVPKRVTAPPLPPQNRRRRGGPVEATVLVTTQADSPSPESTPVSADESVTPLPVPTVSSPETDLNVAEEPTEPLIPQLSQEEGEAKVTAYQAELDAGASEGERQKQAEQMSYCPECYLPLHPDPKPERLYIFLHALRYTTSLGCFETDMPTWAAKGWEWDRSSADMGERV